MEQLVKCVFSNNLNYEHFFVNEAVNREKLEVTTLAHNVRSDSMLLLLLIPVDGKRFDSLHSSVSPNQTQLLVLSHCVREFWVEHVKSCC